MLIPLSEELLYKVKTLSSSKGVQSALQNIPKHKLIHLLKDDRQKKAFWINIYNAYFQILRAQKISKPAVFRKKLISLGVLQLSLDDIEHGILRKHKLKWALGYLSDPFASSIIKELAVSEVDYRIHFALNCGAKSCPPIAFYSPNKIDLQLDLATLSFLESETDIIPEKNEMHVSRIFLWYLRDFGGLKGIKHIHQAKLGIDTGKIRLRFKAYDWNDDLHNFTKSDPIENGL